MIWSISWKNVWRSKVRSLVVMIAVAIGMVSGIFTLGVAEGMMDERVKDGISYEVSHIQIHHPDFLANGDTEFAIENADKIRAEIQAMPGVKATSRRTKYISTAQTPYALSNVVLYGINIEQERKVSSLYEKVLDGTGSYFDGKQRNPIFVGEKMAKNLRIVHYVFNEETIVNLRAKELPEKLISKLAKTDPNKVFRTEEKIKAHLETMLGKTDAQLYGYAIRNAAKSYKTRTRMNLHLKDTAGHSVQARFRPTGIFKTSNDLYDGMFMFVDNQDILKLTGNDPSTSHEIAILLDNINLVPEFKKALEAKYPQLEVETWKQLSPQLQMLADYMGYMTFILMIIILFALGFGIVNTMLMVVLERVKELGMLMAIGMNKKRIFSMVMLETIFLSLTGGVIGLFIGWLLIMYFGEVGISLGSANEEVMQSIGYVSKIYPKLAFYNYVTTTILIVLTGVVAAIYPARKALKLEPVEAIRID